MRSFCRRAFVLVLCLTPASFAADIVTPTIPPPPPALAKPAPETVDDLRAIQEQTKAIFGKVKPCTVGLLIGSAAGSGVIVSEDGTVLTAGHVSGDANRDVRVILSDGRTVRGKTLGANRTIDSGMIKITDSGPWPFVELGVSADLKTGDWVIATGHPGGYQPGRSPPLRLGRIGRATKDLIRTDCTLVGGDSGGPLFDMHGKLIGIHSRISLLITENIHVPVDTYRETWERLAKSEVWGAGIGRADVAYLGLYCETDPKGCKVVSVTAGSPAEKAGFKVGDIVLRFDEKDVKNFDELGALIGKKKINEDAAIDILRGEEELTLKAKISRRQTPGR